MIKTEQKYRVEFDDDDERWCVWGDDFSRTNSQLSSWPRP